MKGIVLHFNGHIKRALQGRCNEGRLSVKPIMAVPPPGEMTTRPVFVVFYEGERLIACSSRVLLTRGRRYPEVEHWFVLPECARHLEASEQQQAQAAQA